MILLVMGLPGTGKSTIAGYVAQNLDAEILTTDQIRKEIFKHTTLEKILKTKDPICYNLQEIFDRQPEYQVTERFQRLIEEQKLIVYDELFDQLRERIQKDKNVVLDGTFFRRAIRERAYKIAKETQTSIYIINTECPERVIARRLENRKKQPDIASYVDKMKIYEIVKRNFEAPNEDGIPLIIVNTYTSKITRHNIGENDIQANQLIELLKKQR